MTGALHKLRCDWDCWASGADKSENGWQSYYPRWGDLMSAAIAAMIQPAVSDEGFRDIEWCWAISEEDEELADYAKGHFEQCWEVLHRLAESVHRDVRWQVYSVLGVAGHRPEAERLLRSGLDDPDRYCRRRALLALARLAPRDAKHIATRHSTPDAPPALPGTS